MNANQIKEVEEQTRLIKSLGEKLLVLLDNQHRIVNIHRQDIAAKLDAGRHQIKSSLSVAYNAHTLCGTEAVKS